jgi:hypothetical protein
MIRKKQGPDIFRHEDYDHSDSVFDFLCNGNTRRGDVGRDVSQYKLEFNNESLMLELLFNHTLKRPFDETDKVIDVI